MAECHWVKQDRTICSMNGGCGAATSRGKAKGIRNFDELAKQACNVCRNELRGKDDWLDGQRELSLSAPPTAAPEKEMALRAIAIMTSFP